MMAAMAISHWYPLDNHRMDQYPGLGFLFNADGGILLARLLNLFLPSDKILNPANKGRMIPAFIGFDRGLIILFDYYLIA
jgi:hypothetical protein